MPTTREASTPSRRAISRAESNRNLLVATELQLRFPVYLPRETPSRKLARFVFTSHYNTLEPLTGMRRAGQTRFFFALAALLLWLAPASAQSPAPQNSPAGTSKTDRKSTRLNSSHVAISY